MKSQQISFPSEMTIESETERITNAVDVTDIEVLVDDSVQEAAEVNYFENTKPANMRYNPKTSKWVISKEFEKTINDLETLDPSSDDWESTIETLKNDETISDQIKQCLKDFNCYFD